MSHLPWEGTLPAYCDSGYAIHPLLTYTAFAEESERLGGCIASVEMTATLCEAGIAHVFSIQAGFTGERVAMASITLCDHLMPWKLQWVAALPADRTAAHR